MATDSAARCTSYTGPHGSLHQTNVLITFISSSAGWIYPIDRFFGRALYGSLYGKLLDRSVVYVYLYICKHRPAWLYISLAIYFMLRVLLRY